ncbi:hypothetical protein [Marinobacterium litorale]|uniref:hypothetical protein n=1 Tax=Marinobacterium litorale TaxID=404770 RepID=UPI0006886F5D|nr:hypothetical protein [Marinobacterium litorale]
MNINDIVNLQHEFDKSHGWSLESSSNIELVDWVSRDIVGIVGELGEFSNIIKKAALLRDDENEVDDFILKNMAHLHEEIIDIFIYVMRIATHTGLNIEEEYLKKLSANKKRFYKFERN